MCFKLILAARKLVNYMRRRRLGGLQNIYPDEGTSCETKIAEKEALLSEPFEVNNTRLGGGGMVSLGAKTRYDWIAGD
jgi:hypothetical protein